MVGFAKFFRFSCFLGILFVGYSGCLMFGGELRDFTNKAGTSIRAEVITISGSSIRIKRESDGQEFDIPIVTLSLDDQVWIQERVRDIENRGKEGEWTRLRIDLPTVSDRVRVVGNNSLILSSPVGSNSYDLLLPVGAWVSIAVRCYDDPAEILEHQVKYLGANHWKVTDESRMLLVSRDSGEEKIVGITLPDDESGRFLDRIDRARIDSHLCIELPRNRETDGIDHLGVPISAFTCDSALKADDVSALAEFHPKALDISVEENAVDRLIEFGSLEALHLGVSVRAQVVDGVKEQYAADRIVFSDFPDVRDLQLRSIPFTDEFGDLLAGMSRLRMLEFYWTSANSMTLRARPVWNGVSRLADSLESFRPGPGLKFERLDLEGLHSLRALTLTAGNLVSEDGDVTFLPEDMQHLLALEESLLYSKHDNERFEKWIEIGSFPKLRRLHTYSLGDLEAVPNLEVLHVTGRYEEAEETDLAGIETLKNLFSLALNHLSREDIKRLTALPFSDKIEFLRLGLSDLSEPTQLARLSSLRILEVLESGGAFRAIDISEFPSLTMLVAYKESNFAEIRGINEAENFRALRVRDCEALSDLGFARENSNLQSIELSQCDGLESLSVFEQTSGLTQVVISGCDKIEGPLRFLDANPLRYLSIRSCGGLDDRSIRDLPNYQ